MASSSREAIPYSSSLIATLIIKSLAPLSMMLLANALIRSLNSLDSATQGGPIIDTQSKIGNPLAFQFPKPSFKNPAKKKYQWSYSGLKTAVIYQRDQFCQLPIHTHHVPDILASFQKIAIDMILDTTLKACSDFKIYRLVVSGGVACNSYLRKNLPKNPRHSFLLLLRSLH